MAHAIYRQAPVAPHLESLVTDVWALLPEPAAPLRPILSEHLNWFETTPRFFEVRRSRLASVISGLESLEQGQPLTSKVITSRYTQGLPSVSNAYRRRLLEELRRFADP
jgi:hypothetical protein